MAAVTRRQYKGAAASCTTTNSLTSVDTSVTLSAITGWPSTAAVPFYVVIDPGTSSEEKCSATISGSTLTLTRGADDTTAVAHSSGATIYPVFSADDADEVNNMASTMTTKGDLLVTTGSAFNRLAVGSDGAVLMADSAQTNGVAWVGNGLSNRNVVINGAMQVEQRGTSTASITTLGYYTADRFQFEPGTMGTWTQSSENDAPTGSGFRKSTKILCTTADASPAAGDYIIFYQRLEGQNLQQFLKGTASAKSFAVSFWVKSTTTGTYNIELRDNDNSRIVSAAYTVDVAATWEKKTVIFPADTTGAFDNDNGHSLQLAWWLGAGTTYTSGTRDTLWGTIVQADRAVGQTNLAGTINNAWQITGVQLEVGSVATPFEFEDIGTTLAKCQRYYIRQGGDTNYQTFGAAQASSTTGATGFTVSPVKMRVAPTSIESITSSLRLHDLATGFPITSVLALDVNFNSSYQPTFNFTVASGLTAATFYQLGGNNSINSYIAFSAEF